MAVFDNETFWCHSIYCCSIFVVYFVSIVGWMIFIIFNSYGTNDKMGNFSPRFILELFIHIFCNEVFFRSNGIAAVCMLLSWSCALCDSRLRTELGFIVYNRFSEDYHSTNTSGLSLGLRSFESSMTAISDSIMILINYLCEFIEDSQVCMCLRVCRICKISINVYRQHWSPLLDVLLPFLLLWVCRYSWRLKLSSPSLLFYS